MRTPYRLLSLVLLLAAGCTYNPVRYDSTTGFQTGGGVGVLCGGPLDPWMQHCCPQNDCCWPFNCLSSLFCGSLCGNSCCPAPICQPVCPPICQPVCPPACPTPVCPPICPTPSYQSPGTSWGPAASPMTPLPMMPSAPMGPSGYGAPTPTFAEPCETCAGSPSGFAPNSQYSQYPQYPPNTQGTYLGTTNYPQLFQSPPMAPPAAPPPTNPNDPFMMPTPTNEMPPGAEPMPPNYDDMDMPAEQKSQSPMPQITPRNNNPQQPMPMPNGTNASQTSFPRMIPPHLTQQGVVEPRSLQYDSRRQQGIPLRM